MSNWLIFYLLGALMMWCLYANTAASIPGQGWERLIVWLVISVLWPITMPIGFCCVAIYSILKVYRGKS